MKYGVTFLLLSILAAYYAFLVESAAILLFWTSFSFLLVALSYFGILKRLFFKNRTGKIPVWSKVLYLPFLAYTAFVWHLYRILSKESSTNRISEDLVVGRRLLPYEVTEEYDKYVDLTAEFDEPRAIRERDSYTCFPIQDAGVPDTGRLIHLLNDIEGKKIFLHCAQGHGRTGVVALALLLRKGIINEVKDGVSYLQSFRPALNLNRTQITYLEENKEGITSRVT